MYSIFTYLKKRPPLLILGLILLTGLFFRSFQVVERFEFAHDGDLYSWIVKDILVNYHIRLLGQLTSAPGIFIGGLFYYLLIPFFLLTNMDPVGVTYFAIIMGLSTIFSIYFVLSKLFKIEVGLIAAILYATLLSTVNADRWVVPTITTNLWVIWYFYVTLKIARGNYQLLPLLGILIALIWHVHIALFPVLIAVPAAIILSKKLPSLKQSLSFLAAFFITSLPLFVFEARHGFGQTFSLFANFTSPRESAVGLYKLTLVINMIAKNIGNLFFAPQSINQNLSIVFTVIIALSGFWLVKKRLLLKKELAVLLIWVSGVVAFFSFTSSPISEYYFSNIEIIFLTIISIFLYYLFKSSFPGKILVTGLLLIIPIKNSYFMITQDFYHKGYVEKKAVVNYIRTDAQSRNFPCVGISYITAPGENVGFRYFFYLENMHLVHPSLNVPVYNIVIPDELSLGEVKQKFGHIGVIPPTKIPPKEIIEKSCQTPNTNLTDPLFGYVD